MLNSKQAQFKTAHSPPNQTGAASIAGFAVCLIFTHEGAPEESTSVIVCGSLSAWLECVTEQGAVHILTSSSLVGKNQKPMKGGKKAPNKCALLSGLCGEDDRRISERHFDLIQAQLQGGPAEDCSFACFSVLVCCCCCYWIFVHLFCLG